MDWRLIMGLIAGMIVALGILAYNKVKKQREIRAKYPATQRTIGRDKVWAWELQSELG